MAIDESKVARFMTNNFLETGTASFQVSSIAPSFYLGDMLDPTQRTKVFRFGGRFLIEENVNDKIYINGNTYQIPAGSYNSGSNLASMITSLITFTESVNAYYDSSSKSFYFSGLVGWTMNLATTIEAAWTTLGYITGTNITMLTTDNKYADLNRLHWPNEMIEVDFGYQAEIGFVGIISDLAQELKIPQNAEIRIQGNNVNNFTAPPLNQVIPWFQKGAFKFIDDISDSSWRYIRLIITCPNATSDIDIGYLYIGDYTKFPERNLSTGFEFTHEDSSLLSSSDDGQVYSNDKTPLRVLSSLEVGLARPLTSAFLKSIYKRKQLSIPFFVALDPKMFLSSEFDEHLALVRLTNPPTYKHLIKNLFQIGFGLKEAI